MTQGRTRLDHNVDSVGHRIFRLGDFFRNGDEGCILVLKKSVRAQLLVIFELVIIWTSNTAEPRLDVKTRHQSIFQLRNGHGEGKL